VHDRQKLRQDLKSANQAAAAADRLDLKRDLQELRKTGGTAAKSLEY